MFVGPNTLLATSAWPVEDGARQKQKRPHTPEIAHFIPVDATQLGITPSDALAGIEKGLGPTKAKHDPFLGPDANVANFTKTLKRPLDAVGFIGHSIFAGNNPFYSVGLSFFGGQVLVPPPNNNPPFPVPQYVNSVVTSQIQNQANVVFIGACFIGPTFESLWNINSQTSGQALIVPTDPKSEANLGHAVFAWTRILDDMILQRMSVAVAVAETDQFILGKLDVNNQPVTEQWQVIGDGNVKIW